MKRTIRMSSGVVSRHEVRAVIVGYGYSPKTDVDWIRMDVREQIHGPGTKYISKFRSLHIFTSKAYTEISARTFTQNKSSNWVSFPIGFDTWVAEAALKSCIEHLGFSRVATRAIMAALGS